MSAELADALSALLDASPEGSVLIHRREGATAIHVTSAGRPGALGCGESPAEAALDAVEMLRRTTP